ncbi:MAG: response regulator transcription factor [Muribaculaceae bacterium]|nr:response regulator transcription factor [Muribaculaceae bacterium]
MKHKVLIIEPSELIVDGLKTLLAAQPSLRLLEPLAGDDDLDARLAMLRPDVLIINPTVNDNVNRLRGDRGTRVVALVYQYVKQSRLRHFDAVIDIRDSRQAIAQTVIDAANSSNEPDTCASAAGNYELTKRETAVLVEVARGLTNKEIAERLNVSVFTVTSHRKNIVRKTGIKSVAGLTVYALLNNLIDEDAVL